MSASPECNNLALTSFFLLANDCNMEEQEQNGGPNHLRAWREFRGLKQEQLAEMGGTSFQVIGYLERGRTQLSAKWLRRLAPALQTTPGLLLDHDPNDLDSDMIEKWVKANPGQRRQINEIVTTILRTGTDD